MATYTPNLNLKKPAGSDPALISDINGNMDTLDTAVNNKLDKTGTANKAKGLIYLEPTVTTTGVLWSATSSDITSYYDGLMVVVRCPENTANNLTMKINSLTAPKFVFNVTSNISTRYSADSIIIATYKTIDGTAYWSIMDYDANTDTKVRQYQATNNVNYPILTRYNTTDKAGTYEATYARFAPAVTLNPSTGTITATKFSGGGASRIFSNKTVSTWAADSTYSDFPYKASIALSGVTANDVAWVVYGVADATSGDYAPICETYAGGVYIWSTSNSSVTIPTIVVFKG